MQKIIKFLAAILISVFAVSALTACASSEPLDMKSVSAVIDVRTPAEFATGHLAGAVNFDIQGADFATQVETLDKAANYVVYCHSGNRAGKAVSYMQDHGFTGTVTNAGGVADAAATTGLALVQ